MSTQIPRISGVGLMPSRYDRIEEFDRELGMIEAIGADHAEVSSSESRIIGGGRLIPERATRVKEAMLRRNLRYTIHCPLALDFMDEARRDLHMATARSCIEFCREVGSPVLVIHPGWIDPRDQAAQLPRLMELERAALSELAPEAERAGVLLALENMPVMGDTLTGSRTTYAFDPAAVARQIRAVDHPSVVGTIDYSHAWISADNFGIDIVDFLRPLAPLTRHLHVHDSFGRVPTMTRWSRGDEAQAYGMGDLHMPVGWGNIPWERLFSELVPLPATTITLEIDHVYADERTFVESLERARALAALLPPVAGA